MTVQEYIQDAISKNEFYAIDETQFDDWEQAFECYSKLEKKGNAKAQFNLGYMYAHGSLVKRDLAAAFGWYEKASAKDDPRAHYNLSQMYELGEFVAKDSLKAMEHLALANDLGDERAKLKSTLVSAKEALKHGDRAKALPLFASISANCKEAEMGIIACSAAFKSLYNTRIKYSYHSKVTIKSKQFWQWGEAVLTELELNMINNSANSWPVMVKALIRVGDGEPMISTIGDALKANEVHLYIIQREDSDAANICGVAVYSDREGSPDKPVYLFHFPDVPVKPGEDEIKNLPIKIQKAQEEMEQYNKTAKPSGCFVLTACYGSYDAPTVLTFRQFRDQHLAQYKLGRHFISWYYTHGPQWAAAIDNKPRAKAIFRAVFTQLAKVLPK
jgi:hypothetical protein